MSNTINVTSLLELNEALSTATGGETILLAPGDYGDLALTGRSGFDVTFPSNVTITSADPQDPAVFSGLDVRDAGNLTFDGVTFDYIFQDGDYLFDTPFSVAASENITIRNSTFDGDLPSGVSLIDDGYGYGIGLSTRDNTGITIEQNEFFDFYRALVVSSSDDIVVSSNDIYSIRSDGMNFAEVTGVLIENNYIHDFKSSPDSLDHGDMIQFWTNGTQTPSSDIVIRGNQLDIGDGDYTQSIFMRNDLVDRGLAGQEMYYSNITIEENVIVNGHKWGISVGETNGLIIQNNSVLHDDGGDVDGTDATVEIPLINVATTSTNVVISQNATADITGYSDQSDWTVRNNAFVQDQNPADPGYYGDIFLSSSLQADDGVHNFTALPNSILNVLSAGATETLAPTNESGLSARFQVSTSEESAAIRSFDASFSQFGMEELPEGTTYLWDFGDGITANGVQASNVFGDSGDYAVSLTIQLPDGTQTTRTLEVEIPDYVLYSYESTEGTNSAANDGIAIGGTGTSLVIQREDVATMLGADEFSVAMTLTADSAATAGEVMRLHQSFITSVNANGELYLQAFTEAGDRIRLTTDGANLNDKEPHDISITLNEGMLEITVDGDTLASTAMTSPLADNGNLDLVLGNPFGNGNFESVVSALRVTANESDFSGASNPTNTVPSEVPPAVDEVAVPPAVEEVEVPPAVHEVAVPPAVDEVEVPPTVEEVAAVPPAVHEVAVPPTVEEVAVPPIVENAQEVNIDVITNAVTIGGTGTKLSVDRERVVDLMGTDDFDISMTLTADSAASTGEVVRLHQSFVTSVNANGELYLQAFTEAGDRIRLTTDGANLNDKEPHDISITLNEGMLEITVDGDTLASTAMTSPLANKGNHDLVFGNPWGKDNFEGVVSTLSITVNESDFSGVSNPIDAFEALASSEGTTTPQDVPISQEVNETDEKSDDFYLSQIPQEQTDHFESLLLPSMDM